MILFTKHTMSSHLNNSSRICFDLILLLWISKYGLIYNCCNEEVGNDDNDDGDDDDDDDGFTKGVWLLLWLLLLILSIAFCSGVIKHPNEEKKNEILNMFWISSE